MRRSDAQGNIWDGPVSNVSTTSAAAQYIGVTTSGNYLYANATGFQGRSCYKDTAELDNVAFRVDDNSGSKAFVQPGDVICYLDNVDSKAGLWHFAFGVDPLGTMYRKRITSYDGSGANGTITVSPASAVTIPNNSEMSTGLTAIFLRTTAGGNQYYVLAEIPFTGYAQVSFFDNVTDAVLSAGTQYLEVPIGKEHNAPPPCTLVCNHQGGLVVARNPLLPNTVAFSTADGIEYFPTASNSFDIPSTQSGSITAIASDTTDRLAVFKERAYYDIQGDLDGGLFSVNVKNEGDYGVTSQASLKRVNNALWGLSKNGWVVVQDGFLDPYKFKGVSSRLINQNYQWAWAVAENDYFNRQYICSIPQVTGEQVTYVIDYSKTKL